MDSSPNIPTDVGANPDSTTDIYTQQLNQQLNSVVLLPQNPSFERGTRMASAEIDYNVGYKMSFVDNQVAIPISQYEAPNVPVTQLPFSQAIYGSMFPQAQVSPLLANPNLRAPSINEGY